MKISLKWISLTIEIAISRPSNYIKSTRVLWWAKYPETTPVSTRKTNCSCLVPTYWGFMEKSQKKSRYTIFFDFSRKIDFLRPSNYIKSTHLWWYRKYPETNRVSTRKTNCSCLAPTYWGLLEKSQKKSRYSNFSDFFTKKTTFYDHLTI